MCILTCISCLSKTMHALVKSCCDNKQYKAHFLSYSNYSAVALMKTLFVLCMSIMYHVSLIIKCVLLTCGMPHVCLLPN